MQLCSKKKYIESSKPIVEKNNFTVIVEHSQYEKHGRLLVYIVMSFHTLDEWSWEPLHLTKFILANSIEQADHDEVLIHCAPHWNEIEILPHHSIPHLNEVHAEVFSMLTCRSSQAPRTPADCEQPPWLQCYRCMWEITYTRYFRGSRIRRRNCSISKVSVQIVGEWN
jgi:hypothetical protein